MRIALGAIAAITSLENRRGRLTPGQVVEAARPEDSILHGYFEWEDSIAAESWRRVQARELIKRVKIVVQLQKTTMRVVRYIRDTAKEATEPGYVALLKCRKEETREVLAEELERVLKLLDRAIKISVVTADDLPQGFADKMRFIRSVTRKAQAML